MFLWICFYFGMRCWPSVLQIISWLCPWCQVTLCVTAKHLLAVASEKARDTCCSVIKKSELTPKVTQQHFFAACCKRDSHTFITPMAYCPGTHSSLNFCRCSIGVLSTSRYLRKSQLLGCPHPYTLTRQNQMTSQVKKICNFLLCP